MDGQSLNIQQDILNKIKEIIPGCFTEDKLDWERLRVFFEDNIEFKNERYHLNWAGKTDAIRLLQTPTYNTLKPCREESVNFDTTENLFIEGDNLEVLKILQKSYFGKIKMIYIDPPYNTGNDFIYKDDFSETLAEYRKKVGDVGENGNATRAGLFRNTKENGQYHSNWLNMMYPRLFLARNLLRDDGVIFVSIDDNEVYNLRLIMDEIFGEENFVGEFIRKTKSMTGDKKSGFNLQHENLICYAKNIENVFLEGENKSYEAYDNPDNDPNGEWTSADPSAKSGGATLYYPIQNPYTQKIDYPPKGRYWAFSKETFEKYVKIGKIKFKTEHNKDERGFIFKRYKSELQTNRNPVNSLDFCENVYMNQTGTIELRNLMNGEFFQNPKPTNFIKKIIYYSTNSSDIILDFFAGSGTTAHAVMELNKEDGGNRKFILVQLPEPTDPESEAYKAGYKTIADIAKERIRRAAKKIQEELNEEQKKKDGELPLEQTETKKLDLGFKVFKLDESNFKQWRPFRPENAEEIKQAVLEFTENVKSDAKTENLLYELILKNGKKLTDKMEKKNSFYVINENELVLLLEEINKEMVDEIIKLKPQKVIALDKIFNGNDQLKTNTVLQFKDAGVEFKSV